MQSTLRMETFPHSEGKLIRPVCTEATNTGNVTSKRLHIGDFESNLVFLVDTDFDVSILPVDKKAKPQPSDTVLFTADNSPVSTFGEKRISLDLKLRRKFSWNFCVAAVSNHILGWIFLHTTTSYQRYTILA